MSFTAPTPETEKTYGKRARTRSAIGRGSKAKGADGEREVLAALKNVMLNVEDDLKAKGLHIVGRSGDVKRNSLQSSGGGFDIHGLPLIAVEVKRCETLSLNTWWAQCIKQAGKGELPVLVYRQNREAWRVMTWLAMTSPKGAIMRYAVGVVTLPDFLSYFSTLYAEFLTGD